MPVWLSCPASVLRMCATSYLLKVESIGGRPRHGESPLAEGHATTRERWPASTMVASRPAVAGRLPPLQLMFKAAGGAVPCLAPWLPAEVSPSGSDCETDTLNYLELVPEPLTPGRDWRILLVDARAV
jgi:hypothetical protein